MKLIEALEIIRTGKPGAPAFKAYLACSFTPLHLQTFLHANLQLSHPERSVELRTGLFGDLWGNLERAVSEDPDAIFVVLEWQDLDRRLGLRNLGRWAPKDLPEIAATFKSRAAQLLSWLEATAPKVPVILALPTLPLPPISFTPSWRAGAFELQLRATIAELAAAAVGIRGVAVLNSQRLDQLSPLHVRHDVRAELSSGFPYKMPHASELGALLAQLSQARAPKKGLITDLDDTLWNGILGEVGADGITWDLEHNSHLHGAYQRFLHALAEAGVLIGVASKNDEKNVQKALQRQDLLLPPQSIFPVEAHWGPKSESVARILKAWNIAPDSVVFIDDSPMELAEVNTAFPDLETIRFPKDDPQAVDALFLALRDHFGRTSLSEEDSIRRESLRRAYENKDAAFEQGTVSEEFLRQAEAELSLKFAKQPSDPRAFELVNKTNQFNLNGRRYSEKEWDEFLAAPGSVLLVASYKDKYGPLGKIAVLAGRLEGRRLTIPTWVMSCRAFSRRIEHRCLEELFQKFSLNEISFEFEQTPKNGPTVEFLTEILGSAPTPNCVLSRETFQKNCKPTFHQVLELTHG